jgi:hypothetical protein
MGRSTYGISLFLFNHSFSPDLVSTKLLLSPPILTTRIRLHDPTLIPPRQIQRPPTNRPPTLVQIPTPLQSLRNRHRNNRPLRRPPKNALHNPNPMRRLPFELAQRTPPIRRPLRNDRYHPRQRGLRRVPAEKHLLSGAWEE